LKPTLKPTLCTDLKCNGGECCTFCLKRNIIAEEGHKLIEIIERIPASKEQTTAVNATQNFINMAETMFTNANTLIKKIESPINTQLLKENIEKIETACQQLRTI